MIEAVIASEMAVSFYLIARCNTRKTPIFTVAAVRTLNLPRYYFFNVRYI
jgi:hypothetical protein